jgi:hypothetical protein
VRKVQTTPVPTPYDPDPSDPLRRLTPPPAPDGPPPETIPSSVFGPAATGEVTLSNPDEEAADNLELSLAAVTGRDPDPAVVARRGPVFDDASITPRIDAAEADGRFDDFDASGIDEFLAGEPAPPPRPSPLAPHQTWEEQGLTAGDTPPRRFGGQFWDDIRGPAPVDQAPPGYRAPVLDDQGNLIGRRPAAQSRSLADFVQPVPAPQQTVAAPPAWSPSDFQPPPDPYNMVRPSPQVPTGLPAMAPQIDQGGIMSAQSVGVPRPRPMSPQQARQQVPGMVANAVAGGPAPAGLTGMLTPPGVSPSALGEQTPTARPESFPQPRYAIPRSRPEDLTGEVELTSLAAHDRLEMPQFNPYEDYAKRNPTIPRSPGVDAVAPRPTPPPAGPEGLKVQTKPVPVPGAPAPAPAPAPGAPPVLPSITAMNPSPAAQPVPLGAGTMRMPARNPNAPLEDQGLWKYLSPEGMPAPPTQAAATPESYPQGILSQDMPPVELSAGMPADLLRAPADTGEVVVQGSHGNPTLTTRHQRAWQRLVDKGWTPAQASGIVGTFMVEGFDRLDTRARGDKGTSYGIGQWRKERHESLKAKAAEWGRPWDDLDTQVDFFDWEIRNSPSERRALTRLQAARTPEEAAAAMASYERAVGWKKNGGRGVIHFGRRKHRSNYLHTAFARQR